jgi:hypothetical protein
VIITIALAGGGALYYYLQEHDLKAKQEEEDLKRKTKELAGQFYRVFFLNAFYGYDFLFGLVAY